MSSTSTWPEERHQPPSSADGPVFGAEIIRLACRAPSMHNAQPWAWRVHGRTLELWSDERRRLPAADPLGRNLVISCGAALHHAQVAARGLGWAPEVRRWPRGIGSDLVATISLTPSPPGADEVTRLHALRQRRTDRRRFTAWPVRGERLDRLVAEARAWGAEAVPVTDVVERFRVERLLSRAYLQQAADPLLVEEHRRWTDHSTTDGVPAAAVPATNGQSSNHAPRFEGGQLEDDDPLFLGTDGVIVLCSADDDRAAWSTVGEALSALWLRAIGVGVSIVPLSQVIEVEETRAALRHDILGDVGAPQLLLRVGWQAIGRAELPTTPRRPLEEVLRP